MYFQVQDISSHDLPFGFCGQIPSFSCDLSEIYIPLAHICANWRCFLQTKGQCGSHFKRLLKLWSKIFSGASRQSSQVFRRTLQLRIQDSSRDAALNLLQARHCKNLYRGKRWKLCEYIHDLKFSIASFSFHGFGFKAFTSDHHKASRLQDTSTKPQCDEDANDRCRLTRKGFTSLLSWIIWSMWHLGTEWWAGAWGFPGALFPLENWGTGGDNSVLCLFASWL